MMNSKMNIDTNLSPSFLLSLLVVTLFIVLVTNQAQASERKLTFAVSGVVASVKIKTGEHVKAGSVLAVLDLVPFSAAKRSADAASISAKLILDLSKVRVKQVRELFDALSTSQEEVEKVKIEHANAMSGYQATKSNAEIATWNLQRATLKAPFSGTVSAILGYPGMVINTNAGSPTIVIISTK